MKLGWKEDFAAVIEAVTIELFEAMVKVAKVKAVLLFVEVFALKFSMAQVIL